MTVGNWKVILKRWTRILPSLYQTLTRHCFFATHQYLLIQWNFHWN